MVASGFFKSHFQTYHSTFCSFRSSVCVFIPNCEGIVNQFSVIVNKMPYPLNSFCSNRVSATAAAIGPMWSVWILFGLISDTRLSLLFLTIYFFCINAYMSRNFIVKSVIKSYLLLPLPEQNYEALVVGNDVSCKTRLQIWLEKSQNTVSVIITVTDLGRLLCQISVLITFQFSRRCRVSVQSGIRNESKITFSQ